ncbi:MAG: hypothetical protein Q7S24_00410 [bacterium]|nr:hypothetical protein [bacterium]
MRKVVIARHGEYNDDLTLNTYGAGQMKRLAEHLKTLSCARVIVLASTATRASASGDVMADVMGCAIEYHELLWPDNEHGEDPLKVIDLIKRKADDFDMVIIVTHLEYTDCLPQDVGRMLGGMMVPYSLISKGHAWIFDTVDKTSILV